jgi:membrane-associated phospholipid phosphatase
MAKQPADKKLTASGIFSEMRDILREAWGFAWKWKWFYLAGLVVFLPAVFFVMSRDAILLPYFRIVDSPSANHFALFMQKIGETTGTTLILYVSLFTTGLWFKRKKFMRVALVMMLAVVISGVSLYLVRFTTGRARPVVRDHPGRFEWFEVNPYYNSFPSAHCGEAWTVAIVLSAAYPPAAIPAGAYAGTMMWARMQRRQHFPSDVLAGSIWGVLFALPFAMTLRAGRK